MDAIKSTLGNVFTMGGTAVSWQSSLQDVIANSTTELKRNIYPLPNHSKKAKWLKGLVGEMCPKRSLVRVHCDSENAIHLARHQKTFHRKTKHIDIRYNFIQDEVKHNRVG